METIKKIHIHLQETKNNQWELLYCDDPQGSRSEIQYKDEISHLPIVADTKEKIIENFKEYLTKKNISAVLFQ